MPGIGHRRLWSGLIVVALACTAITGGAEEASAGPDHSAGLEQGGAGGSIGLSEEGPITKPVATETGSNPAQPRYLVVNAGRCLLDEIRNADGTRTPVWGTTWLTVLADENPDGTSNVVDAVCARTAPPPPPPPPTPTEIWQFVPLTKSEIGINPRGDGLTGLDTWLWHEGERTGVEVAPVLRGYSLVVKARPVLYKWAMGDQPKTVYTTRVSGTEQQPAARHEYRTKGDYTVTMQIVWEGSYTFSGFGVSSAGSLGSVTVTRTRPYHVVEVRGVRQ